MNAAAVVVATPVALLRRFPLTSYFIIALVFSWAVVLIVLVGHLPENFLAIIPITMGPTVAALIMTAVTGGRDGIRRLLARLVLWKVPFIWYLFVFLGVPLVFILGTVFLPAQLLRSITYRQPPGFLISGNFLSFCRWRTLFEEPGWRGFALARLQAKWGPLAGSLF